MEENKGWSWLGFLFAPYYYAGYGGMKKGLIFGAVYAIPFVGLLGAIVICIYAGLKARQQLPIKQVAFSWGKVFVVFVEQLCLYFAFMFLFGYFMEGLI